MKQFITGHAKGIAIGFVIIVAIGAVWFVAANAEPALGSYTVTKGNVASSIDEPGTVATENNASIGFQEPGRITRVAVREGDAVSGGEVIATLDTSSLSTGVAQANAASRGAQAKLSALETGATTQTIAVSQASLAAAQQSLANSYTDVLNTVNDAYAKANDGVRTQLAAFFSSPETNNPQLTFTVTDSQVANNILNARVAASAALNVWQAALASTTVSAGQPTLDAALQTAAQNLSAAQNLLALSLTALTDETGLTASTVAGYKVSATTGTNEVNAAVTEVSNAEQAIASEKAAVAEAQAGLALTTASSTTQTIQEQQAAVAQAEAAAQAAQVALNEATLSAPFPGTVQNLTAQVGQVVSPGTPVLTLVNRNGLKINAYVSELDVAKIGVGVAANITLDAFGPGTVFPADVTAVDSDQTMVNGVPSYLATLEFTGLVPQVKVGMTGNVHLIIAEDDNVVAVPSRLVLTDGNENFVLVKTAAGTVKRPVTVGLVSTDGTTEITSGVNAGDTLANF